MDIGSLLYELFTKGWHVVRRRLLANIARSKGGESKKKKLRTYKYLFNNRDGLLDLDQRGLPVKHFCSLGVAEGGNVDKLVRQRMRGAEAAAGHGLAPELCWQSCPTLRHYSSMCLSIVR